MNLDEMIARVRAAGTDSLTHFGNGYAHEGGLCLQQHPEEFARFAMLLRERPRPVVYLEIGSASGGAARLLDGAAGFSDVLSIDDGAHRRAGLQDVLLPSHTRRFRGDSHSPEAAMWLAHQPRVDVAFIDGDHSYEGVTQDVAMVLPRCNPGAVIALHDIVACDGVRRAWEELLASGRVRLVDEFIGTDRPLGIGVAEVV